MGINYADRYEFPEKGFFWALSSDFKFYPFPALNTQHEEKKEYDKLNSFFTGDPYKIIVEVEPKRGEEEGNANNNEEVKERDPLASTEEEDEASKIVKINLKEIDRLLYMIRAIENDCSVVP